MDQCGTATQKNPSRTEGYWEIADVELGKTQKIIEIEEKILEYWQNNYNLIDQEGNPTNLVLKIDDFARGGFIDA